MSKSKARNEIGEILKSNLRRIEVALNKQNKNRWSSCTLFKITFIHIFCYYALGTTHLKFLLFFYIRRKPYSKFLVYRS